jgi:hypothetical protein
VLVAIGQASSATLLSGLLDGIAVERRARGRPTSTAPPAAKGWYAGRRLPQRRQGGRQRGRRGQGAAQAIHAMLQGAAARTGDLMDA